MSRILVIDDENEFRFVVKRILEELGHSVLEAENGSDGLDIALRELPELIVCDVHMDMMNGFIVRERLREEASTKLIPVVMMTGQANDAGAWGADANTEYLLKPFGRRELVDAVARALKTGG